MSVTSPEWKLDGPLLLVGAGKMGGAMLEGWLRSGLPSADILVQDPHPQAEFVNWCQSNGVSLAAQQTPLHAPCVIIMAVKPQAIAEVFASIVPIAGPNSVILSIAAGKTIASFADQLPNGAAVVRGMPNTPAAIGRGITVLCPNLHVTAQQRALCEQIMAAVGEVGWVADEWLMDAVTAVSGSGPAYVFLLTEALTQAGINAGLDAALALRLARATISGSGALMAHFETVNPAVLRQNVTSPGGTTAAALDVLMADDGLAPLLDRAVAAAVARSRSLST
jgi:pyrroline-5-carboxylate reductase